MGPRKQTQKQKKGIYEKHSQEHCVLSGYSYRDLTRYAPSQRIFGSQDDRVPVCRTSKFNQVKGEAQSAKPAIIKTAQAQTTPMDQTAVNYQTFDRVTNGKYPLLKRIGECESGFRMVPNKTGSSAFGIFQILKVHDKRAKKMGISRFTPEGNIKLAMALYDEQGTRPWLSSKPCWGKHK